MGDYQNLLRHLAARFCNSNSSKCAHTKKRYFGDSENTLQNKSDVREQNKEDQGNIHQPPLSAESMPPKIILALCPEPPPEYGQRMQSESLRFSRAQQPIGKQVSLFVLHFVGQAK